MNNKNKSPVGAHRPNDGLCRAHTFLVYIDDIKSDIIQNVEYILRRRTKQ